MIRAAIKHTWKSIIFVVGITVLLFGIMLIVTPGPAILIIPLGLAILATEFLWAKNLMNKLKDRVYRKKK